MTIERFFASVTRGQYAWRVTFAAGGYVTVWRRGTQEQGTGSGRRERGALDVDQPSVGNGRRGDGRVHVDLPLQAEDAVRVVRWHNCLPTNVDDTHPARDRGIGGRLRLRFWGEPAPWPRHPQRPDLESGSELQSRPTKRASTRLSEEVADEPRHLQWDHSGCTTGILNQHGERVATLGGDGFNVCPSTHPYAYAPNFNHCCKTANSKAMSLRHQFTLPSQSCEFLRERASWVLCTSCSDYREPTTHVSQYKPGTCPLRIHLPTARQNLTAAAAAETTIP